MISLLGGTKKTRSHQEGVLQDAQSRFSARAFGVNKALPNPRLPASGSGMITSCFIRWPHLSSFVTATQETNLTPVMAGKHFVNSSSCRQSRWPLGIRDFHDPVWWRHGAGCSVRVQRMLHLSRKSRELSKFPLTSYSWAPAPPGALPCASLGPQHLCKGDFRSYFWWVCELWRALLSPHRRQWRRGTTRMCPTLSPIVPSPSHTLSPLSLSLLLFPSYLSPQPWVELIRELSVCY